MFGERGRAKGVLRVKRGREIETDREASRQEGRQKTNKAENDLGWQQLMVTVEMHLAVVVM